MRTPRTIIAVTVAAAALMAAAPAQAQNTLEQHADGQTLFSTSLNSQNLSIECAAVAPGAVHTEVHECYLLGANGFRADASTTGSSPGSAHVAVDYFEGVATQRHQVCVRSSATFADDETITRDLQCFTAGGVVSTPAAGTVDQRASGHTVGSGDSQTTNLALECSALAAPGASTTHLQACYAIGQSDGSRWGAGVTGPKPGQVDATASVVKNVPMQPYKVCVQSRAEFADGSSDQNAVECFVN